MEKHQVLTVLVADDEPELLGAVCQLIDWESLGFRLVGRAGNGLDALQLVEALQPDFLLTDIRMPFISGTALTRQAKAVQPLLQVAFLSGYDDFEYAKAGIEDEIVAYLLKPISMAELTEELRKIHDKIEKRLASLTRPQGGAEALRMVTATMLLDEYARPEPPAAAESLRSAGMEIRGDEHIVVAAFSLPDGAHPELLPMAERIFSRAFSCCGFSSGDRTVLLLASGNGFGRLYASLDELRQATRRAWGGEVLAGLSKEYASLGEGHTAYLEAMEALKIARRGGGLYAAGGWDDMAMLCARALKIIEKEYMDEELSLQSVSERLHISANYLGANIKKFYGDTFMNLLIQKRMDEHIVVAAFSLPDGAHPELLPMAERIFSRAFSCCGFSSGDRTVLLLASGNGFGRLYASLDELRQATRRAWGGEVLAGLSKEYASLGEGHTAYLEAMEALKIARRGGGLYAAGGWDDMAMLCARALKIIEKEYMDEELSLQSVSERLHISANYLGANIKKFYGDTFMNLLIQKRMDVALKLLWGGSSRIAEVSRRCGYADQSYFGYCFKKYYGKSPARMRQEQKEANA